MRQGVKSGESARRTLFSLAVLMCFSSQTSALEKAAIPPSQSQAALNSIAGLLEAGRVQTVEILYVPVDILQNVNLNPERLQKGYAYKIVAARFSGSREASLLVSALRRTELSDAKEDADLRWGIIFRLVGGGVRQIYLDGFGRLGQVDTLPASFHGQLYQWLREITAPLK